MKKKLAVTLKILFSLALLVYLLYKVPFKEILTAISSANFVFIAASVILYFVYIALSAFETSYLTRVQGMFITTLEILKIQLASMFYNLFLPGLISGGAVKWYKFLKYGSKADAAAVVVFNRLLETLMLIFTGIVFALPVILKSENRAIIGVVLLLLILVLGIYVVFLNQKFLSMFERVILKIPLPQVIKSGITKIFESMHKFRKLNARDNIEILSLLFFYHSITLLGSYLLILSLKIDISFYDLAWIRTIVSVLIMLPISFSGLGVREGSLIFLLGNYGVKSELAMAYSLLLFFNMILASLTGGIVEFVNFVSGKKIIKEAKAAETLQKK